MKTCKIASLAFVVTCSAAAFAASGWAWSDSAIDSLVVQDGGTANHPGIVIVLMPSEAPATALAACHTGLQSRFAVDLSRPASKTQYATLLAAQIAQRNVTIAVNEACVEGLSLVRNVVTGSP